MLTWQTFQQGVHKASSEAIIKVQAKVKLASGEATSKLPVELKASCEAYHKASGEARILAF